MRQVLGILLIVGILALAGVLVYRLAGGGDAELPPVPPGQKHYPSTWLENFPAAQEQAQREGKPILVDFQGSDWCKYCILFHHEIADTLEFQQWAAQSAVLVSVDFPEHKLQTQAQSERNARLAEAYGIEFYPTLLLLRPDGSVLTRMGYIEGGPRPWLNTIGPAMAQFRQEQAGAAPANAPASPTTPAGAAPQATPATPAAAPR